MAEQEVTAAEQKLKTLIILILDESSSMNAKKADVIGGFNAFIEEQQAVTADEASFIFLKFSTNVKIVFELEPMSQVPPLSNETFKPDGGTALYDAIAEGVATAEKQEKNFDRIICVIMTDGEENSSKKTSKDQIRQLIADKDKTENWSFVYIGENPEMWARETGQSMNNVAAYDHVAPGAQMRQAASNVAGYRNKKTLREINFFSN